jgi:hypothetical protein
VQIPAARLKPFPLDEAEQQYAVRCYRQISQLGYGCYELRVDFCDRWNGGRGRAVSSQTYLPLLREIAARDPRLTRVMVKGKPVAHFEHRKRAAELIASLTKAKATYRGLAGEKLDSRAFPEPYQNQNELLARFALDRAEKIGVLDRPQSDEIRSRAEVWRRLVGGLRNQFGPRVVGAVRREADRRKLDVTNLLPQ